MVSEKKVYSIKKRQIILHYLGFDFVQRKTKNYFWSESAHLTTQIIQSAANVFI